PECSAACTRPFQGQRKKSLAMYTTRLLTRASVLDCCSPLQPSHTPVPARPDQFIDGIFQRRFRTILAHYSHNNFPTLNVPSSIPSTRTDPYLQNQSEKNFEISTIIFGNPLPRPFSHCSLHHCLDIACVGHWS